MNSSGIFEASPITLALGWTIVHTLWQVAVVGLGLKLILSLFSNQLSNFRYLTSCLALILCMAWTGYTFQQEWQTHQQQESVAAEPLVEEVKSVQWGDGKTIHMPLWTIGGLNQWKSTVSVYIPIIVGFWFWGVLFFTYWLLQGYIRLYQLQRKGLYPTPDEWQRRLAKLCEQLGITKKVQLLISNRVEGPVTFRLFKPVILLPIQLFTGLSVAQIEMLLLHELAHIRRFDYAVNLCQSAVEVLLFYHPVIWWINRQIRIEREHCCDDLVLQIQNNPHVYAHVLTNARAKYSSLKTNLTMSANQERGQMTTRIHRLFGKYEYSVVSMKGIFMALLLVTGLLVQEISAQKNVYSEMNETEILAENPQTNSLENPTEAEASQPTENAELAAAAPSNEKLSDGWGDVLPKNPKPGKCYERTNKDDVYEQVNKEYLIYTGNPANVPKDATKMVLETTPATTKWVKKKGEGCMAEDPNDCLVWCLTDVPAQKQEVWVLKDATQSNQFERKTIKSYVLKKKESFEFIEVVCEKKRTKELITQIQGALQTKGFNAGNNGAMDVKFFDGLTQFQETHDLPIGKLDAQTMQLLEVAY